MTPREYVARVGELIATGHDQEALEFADRHGRNVTPALSAEDFFRVASMFEGLERGIDATAADGLPVGDAAVRPGHARSMAEGR
jgi:hypothetical protein